jgi:hypothetical protein
MDDLLFAKTMIISLLVLTGLMVYHSKQEHGPKPNIDDYFYALSAVESSHDPHAKHKDGEVGLYGVSYPFWKDAIEFSNIRGEHSDCLNPYYSQAVIISYYRRYAREAWNKRDYYTLARIHNGGPLGNSKAHTKAYAKKVMNIIKQEVTQREQRN